MKCHHCGFLNQDTARFCNDCGTALTIPSPQPQQPKKDIAWKWILGIFAVLLVLVVIAIITDSSQSNQTQASPDAHWNSNNGKIEAFVKSQTFMKRQLKSPSTADFPMYTNSGVTVIHQGGGVFVVNSFVDSQNSFGAMLRTRYACTLKDNGDDSWSLISLTTQ